MLLPLKMEKGPRAKECKRTPEAKNGKEIDFPLEPLEGTQPANLFYTSEFQNFKIIIYTALNH